MARASSTRKRFRLAIGPDEELSYQCIYVADPAGLTECVAWLGEQRHVALDLETSGVDFMTDQIATLQLGVALGYDPRAYVIDVRCFTAAELRPVFDVLENRHVIKVGMNIGFEGRFLRKHYGVHLRGVYDIQLAEMVIRAGLWPTDKATGDGHEGGDRAAYTETSMAKLAKRYLQVELDKDEDLRTSFYRTKPGTYSARQLAYAAGDVLVPFYVARHQKPLIAERELKDVIEIEMRCLPVLVEAEVRGMYIDRVAWLALWQEAQANMLAERTALDDLFRTGLPQGELFDLPLRPIYPKTGTALNYDSPKQVKWAIKEYCLGIQWPKEIVIDEARVTELKRLHGREWRERQAERGRVVEVEDTPLWLIPDDYVLLFNTEARTLKLARVRKQLPKELVDHLLGYAGFQIRADTFGKEFLKKHVYDDGRIHTSFHQAVARTGRLSSEPNLQNIPSDQRYRKCFKPTPGYKFVVLDFSQIEPRLSAQVSLDEVYVQTFRDGADIYIRVAETMLGRKAERDEHGELTKEWKLHRKVFKVVVLAMAYRMGAAKLWDTLTIALEKEILKGEIEPPDFKEVRETLHRRFLEVHVGIKAFQDLCEKLADPVEPSRPKLYDEYVGAPVTWIEAPCGRKRFFRPDARDTYTAATNSPIQGCSATITKYAMVLVQDYIDQEGIDACLVNNIHDELVWEVREDQALAFAPVCKRLMEKAASTWITEVPVIAAYPEHSSTGVVDAWVKEV